MKDSKTCKICCKTFTRRNYMLKHMENIHAKRYACSICSRFFPGPTEHACAVKDGRFVCYVENCSLRFASGMTLRLHIRDAHDHGQKIDENTASANFKTKKGARDFVKTLCKSINMLTVCFDELRYQVETMAEFMKTLGYEAQSYSNPKPKNKQKPTTEERDYVEFNDYIEYIEEELIEEVNDDDEMDMVIEDDEQYTEKPKDEMINTDCEEFIANSMPEEKSLLHKDTIVSFPKTDDRIFSTTNAASTKSLNSNTMTTKTAQTMLKLSSPPIIHKKLTNFPTIAKVGSTIIRQLPIDSTPLPKNKAIVNAINSKPTTITTFTTDTPSSEQSTPPLFLKIQYDNTETEVYKADPKITFHFDTRPPEDEKQEFIIST